MEVPKRVNVGARKGPKSDKYYVAYNPIILSCISFMVIKMKFIHYHSCMMFGMKSLSIYALTK